MAGLDFGGDGHGQVMNARQTSIGLHLSEIHCHTPTIVKQYSSAATDGVAKAVTVGLDFPSQVIQSTPDLCYFFGCLLV